MQFYGYRLYCAGHRLPRWQFAFGDGKLQAGELAIDEEVSTTFQRIVRTATFRRPIANEDVFPPLRDAQVVRIVPGRMVVVTGIEMYLSKHYAQTWVLLTSQDFEWGKEQDISTSNVNRYRGVSPHGLRRTTT